jgi:hypothetical protein
MDAFSLFYQLENLYDSSNVQISSHCEKKLFTDIDTATLQEFPVLHRLLAPSLRSDWLHSREPFLKKIPIKGEHFIGRIRRISPDSNTLQRYLCLMNTMLRSTVLGKASNKPRSVFSARLVP